jgi:hypothetical protein
VQKLPPDVRARINAPLADAFAHAFVWAIVMLGVAFVPAAVMALYKPLRPADMDRGETAPGVVPEPVMPA